jgi:2-methylisocitrate lyase-like PEP mutase family enzyme
MKERDVMGRNIAPEALRRELHDAIESGTMITAPGVHDAISAMLVEDAGFPAVYISGFATEGARLGKPDMGFLTKDVMLQQARSVASSVDLPVICDMEGGYGSAVQLQDNIREFEAAGLAGVHLDDEVPPCKCGFIPNIPAIDLISVEEMQGRIRRAVESRRDPNFLIIARSDVYGTVRSDDPARFSLPQDKADEYNFRLRAYADAGADMVFGRAKTKNEIAGMVQSLGKPLLTITNPWLDITLAEFDEAGASIVVTSMPLLFAAMKGMQESLASFKETGRVASFSDRMFPDSDYWRLMETDQYAEVFERYHIR